NLSHAGITGVLFSSRRRHTRWTREWSSDVCSSDVGPLVNLIDFEGDYGGKKRPRLQIGPGSVRPAAVKMGKGRLPARCAAWHERDRKSTRLNSSHVASSYAVFCLKKKKKEFISTCA